MSYTNAELVRAHLSSSTGTSERAMHLPLTLSGNGPQAVFGGAIKAGSLEVRSVRQEKLSMSSFTLTASPHSLAADGVKPDSVTLAGDSSLGEIYIENIDYAVDCENGNLMIKSGGALSVGQPVVAWYYPFSLYLEDVDFRVDYSAGTVWRLVAGDIADGETVWLRFEPESTAFADELIEAGVRDANALIEAEIDPGQEFGANPVLISAATYRALEIVCRAAAARELASLRGMHQTANAWISLSETYNQLAERWLSSFRPPASAPASPAIS